MRLLILFLFIIFNTPFISCERDSNISPTENHSEIYFPPLDSDNWQTQSPAQLNWDAGVMENLYNYLSENGTRAFLILKDGKIVVEKYWGSKIVETGDFDQNSMWYWASAGKSLTSLLVGLSQQNKLLDIGDRTSKFLGKGWTSLPENKEDLITIRHQLTMTTGLAIEEDNLDCTTPNCLKYGVDAGTQWYYHNAPYTLLRKVMENASNRDYNSLTDELLEQTIGLKGNWVMTGDNNVYWSTARDMARFGILILNKGAWDQKIILSDQNYFKEMTTTSQPFNPSYGYLWWLNGKDEIVLPGSTNILPLSFAPNAAQDMITAAGKNGQYLDVIPSQNLVVVRMGEAPSDSLVPVIFHNKVWEYLDQIMD